MNKLSTLRIAKYVPNRKFTSSFQSKTYINLHKKMTCPCCSGKNYEMCCEPYHLQNAFPTTAEALMRSRYCAYAIPNGKYLIETTYPTKRHEHDADDMQDWGEQNTWNQLEIVATPATNQVEFKAFYTDISGKAQLHHELSTFKKLNGKWYYYASRFIQI